MNTYYYDHHFDTAATTTTAASTTTATSTTGATTTTTTFTTPYPALQSSFNAAGTTVQKGSRTPSSSAGALPGGAYRSVVWFQVQD